jgi:hypothetical protein
MKKHLLTGIFVAASAGLLVYTAFYNKGINGGAAERHQKNKEFKSFVPTAKSNQYDVFNRFVRNQPENAVVDNTNVAVNNVTDNTTAYVNTLPLTGLVQPLQIAGLDFKQYAIESGLAQTITNAHTGTTLNIKPNSFVNEYGELAEGTVRVFMREMHSAPEFFMRGVPMNNIESAGMIELKAFDQNGEQLFLNNDKPVDVLMASNHNGPNYNVYTLNESTRSWQIKSAGLKSLKPETGKKKKQTEFDTNISLAPVRKGLHLFKSELRFKTYLNYRAYPEMEAYNNVEWVYTGKNAKQTQLDVMKDRTNPFGSRRKSGLLFNYWTDVKLSKDAQGQLHMVFTNGTEVVDITVKPENMYGHRINADAMFDDYTAALAKKTSKPTHTIIEDEEETFDPAILPQGFSTLNRFTIDELGIWGVNQTLTYEQKADMAVTFTDVEGNKLNTTVLYQYDKSLNTYQAITADKLLNMNYNTTGNNMLFAITGFNTVAVLNSKAFDELVVKANAGYPLLATMFIYNVSSATDVVALFNS